MPNQQGSRQTNGLLFYQSRITLQIVQFKNATFMGEYVIDLPKGLQDKLLAYMRWVRPVYAYQATSKTKARETDDDDEGSEETETEARSENKLGIEEA